MLEKAHQVLARATPQLFLVNRVSKLLLAIDTLQVFMATVCKKSQSMQGSVMP